MLPDLFDEEKLDDESLAKVAGGISIAMIISVCAAAVGVGPDAAICNMDLNTKEDGSCSAKICRIYEQSKPEK